MLSGEDISHGLHLTPHWLKIELYSINANSQRILQVEMLRVLGQYRREIAVERRVVTHKNPKSHCECEAHGFVVKEVFRALALIHQSGEGVPQDLVEAASWYRKAADEGDVEAQWNLGLMYCNGVGIPKDFFEASELSRKAAEHGHVSAQWSLGVMYQNGEGVAKDFVEAASWYREAADQNDADAQYALGLLYETGQGVPMDMEEAAEWYGKAAGQDHADAQTAFSRMRHKRLD
jgi:TPR repeat protein